MQKPSETGIDVTNPSLAYDSVVVVDVVLGVAGQAASTAGAVGRRLQSLAEPVARALLRPPVLPSRLQPATWLSGAARRGAVYRDEAQQELDHILDVLVPVLVSQLAGRLDLTKLVQEQVDMTALAQVVIADIDLPEIIRESTAAVASDTVLGVRMQSISGDEAIARALSRLRLRLGGRAAAPVVAAPVVSAQQPTVEASAGPGVQAGTS